MAAATTLLPLVAYSSPCVKVTVPGQLVKAIYSFWVSLVLSDIPSNVARHKSGAGGMEE